MASRYTRVDWKGVEGQESYIRETPNPYYYYNFIIIIVIIIIIVTSDTGISKL